MRYLYGGISAAIGFTRDFFKWRRERKAGDMKPFAITHPVPILILIVVCLAMGGTGLWLMFYHSTTPASVSVAPQQVPPTAGAQPVSIEPKPKPPAASGERVQAPTPKSSPLPASNPPQQAQTHTVPPPEPNTQGGNGNCQANAYGGNATVENSCNINQARTLTDKQRSDLQNAISKYPQQTISITSFLSADDAHNFGIEIGTQILRGGWIVQGNAVNMAVATKFDAVRGLAILVKDKSTLPPKALQLQAALAEANLPAPILDGDSNDTDTVLLWIGSR